jgi:hypothetical protein
MRSVLYLEIDGERDISPFRTVGFVDPSLEYCLAPAISRGGDDLGLPGQILFKMALDALETPSIHPRKSDHLGADLSVGVIATRLARYPDTLELHLFDLLSNRRREMTFNPNESFLTSESPIECVEIDAKNGAETPRYTASVFDLEWIRIDGRNIDRNRQRFAITVVDVATPCGNLDVVEIMLFCEFAQPVVSRDLQVQ